MFYSIYLTFWSRTSGTKYEVHKSVTVNITCVGTIHNISAEFRYIGNFSNFQSIATINRLHQ